MNWLIINQRDVSSNNWPVIGGFLAEEREPINREQIMRRLDWLAAVLDDRYAVPGTKFRFGWDTLIGLVPVAGDSVTTAMSVYFMWEANRLGVSKWTLWRMLGNVGIDFVLGAVPIIGDLCDITWRANRKNLKLLKQELARDSRVREVSY